MLVVQTCLAECTVGDQRWKLNLTDLQWLKTKTNCKPANQEAEQRNLIPDLQSRHRRRCRSPASNQSYCRKTRRRWENSVIMSNGFLNFKVKRNVALVKQRWDLPRLHQRFPRFAISMERCERIIRSVWTPCGPTDGSVLKIVYFWITPISTWDKTTSVCLSGTPNIQ